MSVVITRYHTGVASTLYHWGRIKGLTPQYSSKLMTASYCFRMPVGPCLHGMNSHIVKE